MDNAMAPEFPTTLDWLNLAKPLRMSQLRGRVTALAFFNASSPWSMQQLSDLAVLRRRHADNLHVVAVHVPRFDHERDSRRVAKRLQRSSLDFPIAHDADWVLWQQYAIDAWPTVVFINGHGQVRERIVGDVPVRDLDGCVSRLRSEETVQSLNTEPYELRRDRDTALALRYPIGIAVGPKHLYIVDSAHHRVLECDHNGRIYRQFGSGGAGYIDGPMELAAFQYPQELCLQRDTLYIADTGNHAIRRIKLGSGDVDTLCGSGRPGKPVEGVVRDPRSVSLDQPRAVVVTPSNVLCIACAGDNRLWTYNLGDKSLGFLAGSGAFEITDGEGAAASFAGPGSLAVVQQILYVCDEVGSTIRSVNLRNRQVTTLVGQDPWHFGKVDGSRVDALLQQPQAIALDGKTPVLWIADSGNDQLRTLRLGGGELATVALSQPLHSPAGLAVSDGVVWIADTEAHAVLRFEPDSGVIRQISIGE